MSMYSKDTKSGYFTHAAWDKDCPSCKQRIHAGQVVGISFIVPKSERKWLCHSCAIAAVGVR